MWNDLMRRWMKLATWWMPNNEHAAQPTERGAPQPQATPQASPQASPQPTAKTTATGTHSADLTAIKGIGPAMQKRLEAIGILSPADLAAADAETLTRMLKADKAVVSAAKVSEWIEAARQA
mgnify:CR=1 FL=1|jgi:large subunit ribosomal protein L21